MSVLQVIQLRKLNQGLHPARVLDSLPTHTEISPADDPAATELPQSPTTQPSDSLGAHRSDDCSANQSGPESSWPGMPPQPDNPQVQTNACGRAAVSTSGRCPDTSKPSPQTRVASQQGRSDTQKGTKASSRPSSWQRRKAAKLRLSQATHHQGTVYAHISTRIAELARRNDSPDPCPSFRACKICMCCCPFAVF